MFELNGVELTSQDIKNYAQENNMSFTEGYEFLLSKGLKEKKRRVICWPYGELVSTNRPC